MGESRFSAIPVHGLPEIAPGADIAAMIIDLAEPEPGDILVISQKVVSKSEGRIVELAAVDPSQKAVAIAGEHDKNPRLVELVIRESDSLLRTERGVLITRTRHGFVCANAGIDSSNVPGSEAVVLLPQDPDQSARTIRARMRELMPFGNPPPAILITDSFGRAWRLGQVETAIGAAGLTNLDDWRGRTDHEGRELKATVIAIADQAAAAADLARNKIDRVPAVILRGLGDYVTEQDGAGVASMIRPPDEDLFT